MTGMTVVLGWDGLDGQLLDEFGLTDRFGRYVSNIDTIENEVIGEPHTDELWPSIITGKSPAEHGIWAATPGKSLQWENNLIQTASTVAEWTLPATVRIRIGQWLLDNNKNLEGDPSYFETQGLDTVFDGRRSQPISVPNYRSSTDRLHSFEYDRSALWGDLVSSDGSGGHETYASTREIEERIFAAAGRRIGLVEASIRREYDLVFCWFGFIDSVGHVAPLTEEPGWQERQYRQAARWTERIRDQLGEDDELLVVSDHGLRNGEHTHDAVLAGSSDAITNCQSVLEVRDVIEAVTQSRNPISDPPVRDQYRIKNQLAESSTSRKEVQDRLSDLGYI